MTQKEFADLVDKYGKNPNRRTRAMLMSTEIKQPITYESLSEVAYGDLLATFKELGVESAWKPGKKKSDMIQNALGQLTVIKQGLAEGKSQEEIDQSLEVQKTIQEEAPQKAKEEEEAKDKVKEEIVSKDLSKEQIEAAIKNIDANLKGGASTHRLILLAKRKALQEQLAEKK
jgi:DNA-binding transcriptional regulator GbsR (MarR family)